MAADKILLPFLKEKEAFILARQQAEEKGGSVFVTILLSLLIVGLVIALLYVLNMVGVPLPFVQGIKENRFEKALESFNYQAAYTVYDKSDNKVIQQQTINEHLDSYFELCFSSEYNDNTWQQYRGIEVFNSLIKDSVFEKIDKTVQEYYQGIYSEDDAKLYLTRLSKFSFCKEKLTDALEEVNQKDYSDKAYNQGVQYYTDGEFEKSVLEFKKVSHSDPNRYPLALENIERIKNEWGSEQLKQAQNMIDVHNLEGATALLEQLIQLFEEYPEAQELLDSIAPVLEG